MWLKLYDDMKNYREEFENKWNRKKTLEQL